MIRKGEIRCKSHDPCLGGFGGDPELKLFRADPELKRFRAGAEMSVEKRYEALRISTFPPLLPTASCTPRSAQHVGGLAVGTWLVRQVQFSEDANRSSRDICAF